VGGVALPVAGKTGTTNDYRNAAFLGVVPRLGAEGWEAASGFTVGAYVGFDDNRSLHNRAIRLQGANGALPVWIGVADGIARAGLVGTPDPNTEAELATSAGLVRVAVDDVGLPIEGNSERRVLARVGSAVPDIDLRPIERAPRRWPTALEAAARGPARPIGFGEPEEPPP
jgi:membrane peptidoglycan carboxypeptidase